MQILKKQLHHERANTAMYAQDHHRVHHEHCEHTRFFDKDNRLILGTCLDCGHTIFLGHWGVLYDHPKHPPLDDATLAAERKRYNEFWKTSIESHQRWIDEWQGEQPDELEGFYPEDHPVMKNRARVEKIAREHESAKAIQPKAPPVARNRRNDKER